jgi:hypothetical protein
VVRRYGRFLDNYAGVSARILNFLSRQLDRLGKAESAIQINR